MKIWYILTPVVLALIEAYILVRYPFWSVHVPIALLSLSAVYARGFLDAKSYITMVAVAAYIVDVVAASYHGQIVLASLVAAVVTMLIRESAPEGQHKVRRSNRLPIQVLAPVMVYGFITALWTGNVYRGLFIDMIWYAVVVGGLYTGIVLFVGRYREAT